MTAVQRMTRQWCQQHVFAQVLAVLKLCSPCCTRPSVVMKHVKTCLCIMLLAAAAGLQGQLVTSSLSLCQHQVWMCQKVAASSHCRVQSCPAALEALAMFCIFFVAGFTSFRAHDSQNQLVNKLAPMCASNFAWCNAVQSILQLGGSKHLQHLLP